MTHKIKKAIITSLNSRVSAKVTNGTLEMLVYGDIVDAATMEMLNAYGVETDAVCAASIKKQIDAASPHSKIALRINSPGGDAAEGVAIHNLLRAQNKPVSVCVDGLAASSASLVAMAGDDISMGTGAMIMIHNAWTVCVGTKDDMRKTADTLDVVNASINSIYTKRTGLSPATISTMMDDETWMGAADCVSKGFANRIAGDERSLSAAASATSFQLSSRFTNLPPCLTKACRLERAAACAKTTGPLSLDMAEKILRANGISLKKQSPKSAKKRDVQIILAGEGFVNGGGHIARRFTK